MAETSASERRNRQPAVAGMFYPSDPVELRDLVKRMISEGQESASCVRSGRFPKAVIAPHAGYAYSGAVAGSAYAAIQAGRGVIRRVVLIGPAHRVGFAGVASTTASAFDSPLGVVPVDQASIRQLDTLYFVHTLDQAHALDHALEVQLPFLIEALSNSESVESSFSIVPLLAGQIGYDHIADLYDVLWGGDETLILISSDLSHYKDYATAVRTDASTAKAIESKCAGSLSSEQACGHVAIQGMLEAASRRGLSVECVDLRNSGDTAGPKNQVVGYGAFLFWSDESSAVGRSGLSDEEVEDIESISEEDGRVLMEVARSSIAYGLKHHQPLKVSLTDYSDILRSRRAVFVTLKIGDSLRGCIGNLEPLATLVEDTSRNAFSAAFSDPRFPPLGEQEFERISIHLSILTSPRPVSFTNERDLIRQIRPGVDGLILEQSGRRGTFLPSVWESLGKAEVFLSHLKVKAGLPPGELTSAAKVWRYEAISVA